MDDVLIIDDMPDNLRVLSAILTKQGYKVRKALSGQSAIASIQASLPSIILLDVRMPEMDGYAVCQILKDNPRTSHIPVIFISALSDVMDKVKAFDAGGVDYITKPFQEAEVIARVETQMRLQKLQHQLIQCNEELLHSNRELEQFAYAVSHDLQQPLQTMMGFAKLLMMKHETHLDKTSVEYLAGILESGRRSQQLIQGLLSYAQLGHQERELNTTDCTVILDIVLENLETSIAEKNASITYENLPVVQANQVQLVQVFQNLIGNAIKFVTEGRSPQVLVTATQRETDWLFAIHDNGIGIEASHLKSIFEIFQRLHTAENYPGTGLGLAICRKIVELHRGRIWAESQPGVGSVFYFTLPV
ncbi:response regulator [Thermoleptolyngbya sichuanensis A183]|uniref:histidine kinase n=1 Tax=Thermoleptolyngbya sichuanensis A183 TaxID=2737172 RepID=A0A6M8B8I7_9CYAN|nr:MULTISPECIES: response regulator [Thermoleptolyngbya]QKD82788.1 response regulator [Thermoleptolyngbya sichuanensis A183]